MQEALPLAFIIEDDWRLADIFSRALETSGFAIQKLEDGRQAMTALQSLEPVLVILDLHLPYVSGQEILRFIRSEPRLREAWVVITTADPTLASFVEDDPDLVLVKPVSFVQLQTLVQRLSNSALRDGTSSDTGGGSSLEPF